MDGKHFPMKDYQAGVTAPPFHPWCRTVTCPWFDDEFTAGETRVARGEDGKTYQVPANMKYQDWRDYFVDHTKDPAKLLKPAKVERTQVAGQYKAKTADGQLIAQEKSLKKIKNGEYSVNWEKVQSKEYYHKYDMLSDNQKANSAVRTRAIWALNNRDGSITEELYAVDMRSGTEIGRIADQNHARGVTRSEKFDRKLHEACRDGAKIMMIHNHPSGLPPSLPDINNLYEYSPGAMGITVGHDGSVYLYSRPKKIIPKSDYIVELMSKKEYSETTGMELALKSLSSQYGFIFKKL